MNVYLYSITILFLIILLPKIYKKQFLTTKNEIYGYQVNPHQVKKGISFYKTKRLIVCGLMRNCSKNVNGMRLQIESWLPFFDKIHVLIVENDSTDGTRAQLLQWRKEIKDSSYEIDILGCGINSIQCNLKLPSVNPPRIFGVPLITDISKTRMNKMVNLRNLYLDHIRNNNCLREFDYTCILDMDIKGCIPMEGFLHTGYVFEKNQNCHSICTNGWARKNDLDEYNYYDTLAFKPKGQPYIPILNCYIRNQFGNKPWEILSGFGGCAIYETKYMIQNQYRLVKDWIGYQCEHIHFNSHMNMMIDPAFRFIVESNGE